MPVLNLDTLTDQRTRAYLYRVLLVLAPLAVFYGVASEAEVVLWLGVGGSVLGLGTAAYNTPRTSKSERLASQRDALIASGVDPADLLELYTNRTRGNGQH